MLFRSSFLVEALTLNNGRKLYRYLKAQSFDEEALDILESLPWE